MCISHLTYRKGFVDGRAQLAGLERGAETTLEVTHDVGLLGDGATSQRRAEDLQMTPQNCSEVNFGGGAFHQADQRQAAAVCKRVEIFGKVGAADAVQN